MCLRLFRSERGAVAAFRTEDDDGVCHFRTVVHQRQRPRRAPAAAPGASVDDFFRPERDLPGRLSSSCTYCVFDSGLEVLPSFASDGVPCALNPDNAVYYLWNGRTFVKKVKKINKQQ